TEASYKNGKLPEALTKLKQAEGLLAAGGEAREDLRQALRRWRTDLNLAARLDGIRLERASDWKDRQSAAARTGAAYQKAFGDYGLSPEAADRGEAAERVRASAVKDHLVAALDDWAMIRWAGELPGWEGLLAVARRADPDPYRDRLRDAFRRKDPKA